MSHTLAWLLLAATLTATLTGCSHERRQDSASRKAMPIEKASALKWEACDHGQTLTGSRCTGEPTLLSWAEAAKRCDRLALGDADAWRLPSPDELRSMLATGAWAGSPGRVWTAEAKPLGLGVPDTCCAVAIDIETRECVELEFDTRERVRCVCSQ